MRRRLVVVLGLLLSSAAAAHARPLPDPAPWVLPVNVYAKAKAGDWTILEGETMLGGKIVQLREVIRVGAIADGVAEVQLFEGAADRETWFLSFPVDVKRGPDTNLLYDVPWIATGLREEKTRCAMGGAPFACTMVSYQTTDSRMTVLMAPRVHGSGIVSYAVLTSGQPTSMMRTIGYGTASKVEWGVGPPSADLEANLDVRSFMGGLRAGSEPATDDVYEGDDQPRLGVLDPPSRGAVAVPRFALAAVEVTGAIDKALVRRHVKRNLARFAYCYEKWLLANPSLMGRQTATFAIDDDGKAVDPKASGDGPAGMHECTVKTLQAVEYPDHRGRNAVTLTFDFDPGSPSPPPPPPKRPTKRKLIKKGHPMRGGPDLRGVPFSRGP